MISSQSRHSVRAYEPRARRGRSHSAPAPASTAPRRPWSGTRHPSCGRLGIAIAQEEAQPSSLFAQEYHEVAGLLGDPWTVGVGGRSRQVTRRLSSSIRSERSPVRPAVTSGSIRTDFRPRLLLPSSYRLWEAGAGCFRRWRPWSGRRSIATEIVSRCTSRPRKIRRLRAAARLGIARLLPCGAACTAARMAHGTRGTEPVVPKF
jgi:hypothetical protein